MYEKEGLTSELLQFESTQPIVDLLCGKKNSILSILEDCCLGPATSDAKFTAAVKEQIKSKVAGSRIYTSGFGVSGSGPRV